MNSDFQVTLTFKWPWPADNYIQGIEDFMCWGHGVKHVQRSIKWSPVSAQYLLWPVLK